MIHSKPTDPLVLRPLFAEHPGLEVVAAFKAHIAKTASPETFEFISTCRPPEEGDVIALWTYSLRRSLRPRKDMAPCPICSAQSEKYLEGGTLIWCPASAAIYAIGPMCAITLWKDGRAERAIAAFNMKEQVRRENELLFVRMLSVPELRRWIAEALPHAAAVDQLFAEFHARMPRLVQALSTASKQYDGVLHRVETVQSMGRATYESYPIGRLAGRSFLRGASHIRARLAELDADLAVFDAGSDFEARVDHAALLDAPDRKRGPAAIREARQALELQAAHIAAVHQFLSPSNLELIEEWAGGGAAASRSGKVAMLRVNGEEWRGDLTLLSRPSAVPSDFR